MPAENIEVKIDWNPSDNISYTVEYYLENID
jgi:hypothetical protein